MLTDENLRPYYRQLKRKLVCPAQERTHFLEEAHRSIANFLSENPQATQADVEDFMGSPESLAETYLASIDQDDLRTYLKSRKRSKVLIVTCILTLLVVVLSLAIYLWQQEKAPIYYVGQAATYSSTPDGLLGASSAPVGNAVDVQ